MISLNFSLENNYSFLLIGSLCIYLFSLPALFRSGAHWVWCHRKPWVQDWNT